MPDTPPRPTLPQRVALWILGALMFYIVALYPNFLMARFQPDDVVHYGFLKWMAVVLVLYGAASQLFFTERPVDTRPGRQTLAVTAAILLVIGTFSPIVSFSFVGDVHFFREGYGDGYILLLMAFASAALAVTGRWKQVLVPALGGLAVILWTFLGVQNTISAARTGGAPVLAGNPHEGLAAATMASIQWEWGWVFLFAGSGLLVYSAARRDRLEEAPPWETIAGDDEPEPVAAWESAEAEAAAREAAVTETVPEAGAAEADETAEAGTAGETAEAGAAEETAEPAATEAADEEPVAAEAEETAEAATDAAATDAAEPAAEESEGTTAESSVADEAESASVADAGAAPGAETAAAADASGPEPPAATAADIPAEAGDTPSAEDVAPAAEPTPAAEDSATAGPHAESGSAPDAGAAESSAAETPSAPVETAADKAGKPAASASRPASDAGDEQ